MKTIVLCGLVYDENLGELIIYESAKYLYKTIGLSKGESYNFEKADLHGRVGINEYWEYNPGIIHKVIYIILSVLRRLLAKININASSKLAHFRWRISPNGEKRLLRYFEDKFKNADLIVIDGGGVIECRFHEYQIQLKAIVDVAERKSLPVVFNTVGVVEGFRENDYRYQVMQDVLNAHATKIITVRDDLDTMNNHYLKNGKSATCVADSAVWVSEALKLNKKPETTTIGLGVILSCRYANYGFKLSEDNLFDFWINIIKELENRGYDWKLFWNGYSADYAAGIKALNRMGIKKAEDHIVGSATDCKELVKTIASFKGIISHRLHASITAYSLEVPAIGLDWNGKLKFWGETSGYPKRFFSPDEFDHIKVVDALEQAIQEDYDPVERDHFRDSIWGSIKKACDLI